MRILHVADWFDPTLGYTEYYLAKKQLERGLDIKVVCSNYLTRPRSMNQLGSAIEDNIPVVRLKSACKIRGNIWIFNPITLAQVIKEFSPDIVHCHGLLSPLSQEVLLLKNFSGYKVVGDLITGISPLTLKLTPILKLGLNFWILNKVDALFACSKAIERILLGIFRTPPSKTHFIPLGADQELFKPDRIERERTRTLLGVHPEDVVAIYTGKFLPSKRIHDLLMASKIVIEQHKNFKVVLVGDGPSSYKRRLDSLIHKLRMNNNVLTIKTVHRTKLPNFYNAADIAVWPGTFSISIIEAMACGLPIIIAKSDWTSHYLEYQNGFSFKVGDIATLASLLLELARDDELRKHAGKQSRRMVENKLNWDTISKQYMEIYQSCLEDSV